MSAIGQALRRAFYPTGTIATIRRGPLRGCRYRVTDESGWAPILGRWEPEAQRAYERLVRSGDVVWDLGANTGIHTLLFARLAGASGKVIAFEPMGVNARQIRETCELNGISNVSIVQKAVSDAAGRATFHIGVHDKQGSLVGIGSADGTSLEVECTTMDDFASDDGPPDFVKIDIEGAESRALAGFRSAAASHPTFAIDLHTPSEDVAVGRWLAANGYRAFRLLDGTARSYGSGTREFEPIANLQAGWPDRSGVWGTVIAVHPSRDALLQSLVRS
jgi:FkbM family methyltransferase